VTALVRCNRCGEITDTWLHLELERRIGAMRVNGFADNPERDLCTDCADNFTEFMRELIQ
jgi:hypothetical protein